MRSGTAWSLSRLIARDGQTGTATLFRKRPEAALIELEGEEPQGAVRLTLGEFFRVEFPLRAGCGQAVTLQGTQNVWALVPSIATQAPGRVRMPGLAGDEHPRFMRERRDPSLHRFVCLQTAELLPSFLDEHGREGVSLDKLALDELATFYEAQKDHKRACHVLTVSIEAAAA